MLPHLERAPRTVPPSRAPLDRRSVEWLLALLYAALLVAVIWKLDNSDLPRDATPVPTVAVAVARAQSLMLGFTESLRRVPRDSVPLSHQQSIPEGWPLWTGGANERAPDRHAAPAPDRLPN